MLSASDTKESLGQPRSMRDTAGRRSLPNLLRTHPCCCSRFLDIQIEALGEVEKLKVGQKGQDDDAFQLKQWIALEFETIRSEVDDLQASYDLTIEDLTKRILALEGRAPREEPKPPPDLGPQETELERRVREINVKGNVHFDALTGNMQVLRDISFVPVKGGEKPIATLRNPEHAQPVFDDIAAVGHAFKNNLMIVEGHTGGGENNFWQQLANDRARLVGQELVKRGLHADKIETKGYPGKSGHNKSEVFVKLAMEEKGVMHLVTIARG